MKAKKYENNMVEMSGAVLYNPTLCRETFREKYYMTMISIPRLSGQKDYISVILPGRLLQIKNVSAGDEISIRGQYQSYNERTEEGSHLRLFAHAMEFSDELPLENTNKVFLRGHICKDVIYRKTPLEREIADIFLAVNRTNVKSDYIPCICWGKNAQRAKEMKVGDGILLIGRVQSRQYWKVVDNHRDARIAYEVSASMVKRIQN